MNERFVKLNKNDDEKVLRTKVLPNQRIKRSPLNIQDDELQYNFLQSIKIPKGANFHYCGNRIQINIINSGIYYCNSERIKISIKSLSNNENELKVEIPYKQVSFGVQVNNLSIYNSESEQIIYEESFDDSYVDLNSRGSVQVHDCAEEQTERIFHQKLVNTKKSIQINSGSSYNTNFDTVQYSFNSLGITQRNNKNRKSTQLHHKCLDDNFQQINFVSASSVSIKQTLMPSNNHNNDSENFILQKNLIYGDNVKVIQNINQGFLKAVQLNFFFDGYDKYNLYLDVKSTSYSKQFNFKFGGSTGTIIVNDYV
ncbi:hypothetical protein PVAND_000529 [Polypedilum vanderplanki]|uniref:Uncharacterized protein n=1 Tax=Polypedilum vanderplanki TaxID=319348 RepID=A0A9J6BK85_POLVA|nr:hypothetical protein PVAND_000529 [Polypedilum vanderplanki]